jgi:pimeloyl-ACP methyl ester carboxylesterase
MTVGRRSSPPAENSSVDVPVLMFARLAVQRRGGRTHPITWELAASRNFAVAAVWFTPLLTDEPTVAALRRATGPCLLVGGTGDQYWNAQTARSLPADVVEIDGAEHAIVVTGRLAEAANALGQVITAVEDFLDHVVWP